MASAKGFDLFNYWYRLYREVTNKTLPPIERISTPAKIGFSGKLTGIKSSYRWDTKDLKSLMLFALMHDPLHLPVEEYGNVVNIIASAKAFASWRRHYHDQMSEFGTEAKAIIHTAPTQDEQRFQLNPALAEQLEAFNPSAF